MLIDTHCHLHDHEWFPPERAEECLKNAHASGVEKIICIGTDPQDSLVARDFATSHENVYWTYGIHPEFANDYENMVGSFSSISKLFATNGERAKRGVPVTNLKESERKAELRTCFSESTPENLSVAKMGDDEAGFEQKKNYQSYPVAIGEIGLDYHYEGYDRTAQIRLFEQMLQLARDHGLPVSLHIREAFADAFPVLDNFPELRGVVHSFTGNKRELKQALDRGFYIGVNGYVTYATPPIPPLNCILLETDAPFLTPVPFRGTINTPEYVKYVAACLSEKMGVAEETIVEQTTNHARKLFKI